MVDTIVIIIVHIGIVIIAVQFVRNLSD